MDKIMGTRFAANLKPGDGMTIRTNEGITSFIVDAISHTGTTVHVMGTGIGGELMGQPIVFPSQFDTELPLTYMVK